MLQAGAVRDLISILVVCVIVMGLRPFVFGFEGRIQNFSHFELG